MIGGRRLTIKYGNNRTMNALGTPHLKQFGDSGGRINYGTQCPEKGFNMNKAGTKMRNKRSWDANSFRFMYVLRKRKYTR